MKRIMLPWMILLATVIFSSNLHSQSSEDLQEQIEALNRQISQMEHTFADVNVLEVEHLIKTLKAENKKFEYEMYQDVPGGHSFDRMDTKQANEIRVKIYKFLAESLNPPNPIKDASTLRKAAYRF